MAPWRSGLRLRRLHWNSERFQATAAQRLMCRRLMDLETDHQRRQRYRTDGTLESAEAVARPSEAVGVAAAGAWIPLKLALQAPSGAIPGQVYEEILVVGSEADLALAAQVDRNKQPTVALIRCQVRIPALGAAR